MAVSSPTTDRLAVTFRQSAEPLRARCRRNYIIDRGRGHNARQPVNIKHHVFSSGGPGSIPPIEQGKLTPTRAIYLYVVREEFLQTG
jgi:hypothetical protein